MYSLAAAAAARSTTFRLTLKRVKHNAEPLQLRQITFATLAQYHFYSGLMVSPYIIKPETHMD